MSNAKKKIDAKFNALLAAKKIIKCELIKYNTAIILYEVKTVRTPYYILFSFPDNVYMIDAKTSMYKTTKYDNYEIFLQNITNYLE